MGLVDGPALPEDGAGTTLLGTLDCELGSRLDPPVAEADAETDETVPGLVLRLGRLEGPEAEADPEADSDPEAETGDVPLVAGGKEPLLTGTVGIVPVAELPVLLLGGPEEAEATLELRPVAGGTEPVSELSDGAVADDGGIPDIEGEVVPDETLRDEDSPTEEDGGAPEDCPDDMELPDGTLGDEGPYGPAVLVVVSMRDEETPLSIVLAYGELDGTEMVTTELETPEDGAEGGRDAEELETGVEFDGGKLPDIVIVLDPLERPGPDEIGMLLRAADEELPNPGVELGLSLSTVEDALVVSVSVPVVVRVAVREVNPFVLIVAIELLLLRVVSKVDGGGLPLLDSEDDITAEFESELSVNVDTMVVVKSVICDVEWFVAMVVTRLAVTVTGKLRLSTMVVELSTGGEKLCPEDDGTAELGTVEETPAEDEDSEVGTPDDGTPEDGIPEDGIPEDGTPEEDTPLKLELEPVTASDVDGGGKVMIVTFVVSMSVICEVDMLVAIVVT